MLRKILSALLSACLMASLMVPAFAAGNSEVDYKIGNPYANVAQLLGDKENHYKTNLHTHTTISDASVTLPEMVKAYYDENFDILAITDHGIYGKAWNEDPTRYFMMRICTIANALMDGEDYYKRQYDVLTDEEYKAITEGTYGFDANGENFKPTTDFSKFSPTAEDFASGKNGRTYKRGMNCVTGGAELSAVSAMQNHVNGFFCKNNFGERFAGLLTHEGDYEFYLKGVEEDGGVSFINHPGHYINSKHVSANAKDENELFYFSNLLIKYKSCLGIETFNNSDSESKNNRIFWDELLQYVIPHGRNVWGFSNSDAHELNKVDSEFMDFIIGGGYTQDKLRSAMENGEFFATGRNADKELPHFRPVGAVPQVTGLVVDEENDTITVTAKNAKLIQWVANGNIIETATSTNEKGELVSVIKLREHSKDITCYVRFQILGEGGYCFSNAFVCDDGNMQNYIIKDNRNAFVKLWDSTKRLFERNLLGAGLKILGWEIDKSINAD